MAPTIAFRAPGEGVNPQKVPGGYYTGLVEITGDGAYPAGGYAFGIAQMQTLTGGAATLIEAIDVVNHWGTSAGGGLTAFLAFFAKATSKVQAFGMAAAAGVGTGFTETTAGSLTSSFTCTLRVWYR